MVFDRKNMKKENPHELKINNEGWIAGIKKRHSPHYDARPENIDISLLVIHYISLPPEIFGGDHIDRFFLGKLDPNAHPYFLEISQLKVSAHCVINQQGKMTQYVSLNDRAWHAGISCFEGREKCNDFSIGIELEGSNQQPFTPQQYIRLAQLTECIRIRYPKISRKNIVGHSDIAPGRKIDPGQYFNWPYYLSLLSD